MGHLTRRPGADEVPEFYARYVALVPDGDIAGTLADQLGETLQPLSVLSEDEALHRYAPGKWSIKQVVEHVSDTERVFSVRLLRFARADPTPLPGFEENAYADAAGSDARDLDALAADLRAVRAATVALVRGLAPDAFDRRGTASGVEITARAIPWIIAGHELHHRQILRERYLSGG